jgi:dihydrofolate synthase / folylpolyglutamate synthase
MDINQQYKQALDYLYSFVDFSLTKQLTYTPDKFNLTRMVEFLELLGNPHQKFPIVHVTGTKGKGSTSAMIASVLQQAGYSAGLYTSPHLVDYAERIQINGLPISHMDMVSLVDELKPVIARVPELTTFEITTALSFLYFVRKQVDIAVVEVGLGGRLDSTNVVTPIVSVITTVSYDHQAILGHSLSEIAGEKGGIIKLGIPLVSASQNQEAAQVLARIAAERNSPMIVVGKDTHYAPLEHSLAGQTFWLWKDSDQGRMNAYLEGVQQDWSPKTFQIPLLGAHQLENAASAFTAIGVVQSSGFAIPEEAIKAGFEKVVWPCRFEVLRNKPLVVVDSAHNRDSAQKLRITLDDYMPGEEVTLLFGASEDKDVNGMLVELLPRIKRVIATESIHPRAMPADQIVELVHHLGRPARAVKPLEDALREAIQTAHPGEMILAAGSIFIAAAVRQILKPDLYEI